MCRFNWQWCFTLCALCEWCPMQLDGFRAGRAQSGPVCPAVSCSHPLPLFIDVTALHSQNIALSKSADCEFACTWDKSSKQGSEGGGVLMVHILPVFLHPRTLLWSFCHCLWKNKRQALLPSVFLCCADSSVWLRRVGYQHSALA